MERSDESNSVNRSSFFLTWLHHAADPHPLPQSQQVDFTIHHYAGSVKYTSTGFVVRNRDTLLEDLCNVLGSSNNALVAEVFTPIVGTEGGEGEGKGRKKKGGAISAETVTTKFKTQLAGLMEVIGGTRVQYIRCIKPNKIKSSAVMDHVQVCCEGTRLSPTTRMVTMLTVL
jgi:myosin V